MKDRAFLAKGLVLSLLATRVVGCAPPPPTGQAELPEGTAASNLIRTPLGDSEDAEAWDSVRLAMCECWVETASADPRTVIGADSDVTLDARDDASAWALGSVLRRTDGTVFATSNAKHAGCTQDLLFHWQCTSVPKVEDDSLSYVFQPHLDVSRAWAFNDPDSLRMHSAGSFAQACGGLKLQVSPSRLDHGACGHLSARGMCTSTPDYLDVGDQEEFISCSTDTKTLRHPFCYGDFNYCVGTKLLSSARSVAKRPRTMGIRDALLSRGAVHLQEAVAEYAQGLEGDPTGFLLMSGGQSFSRINVAGQPTPYSRASTDAGVPNFNFDGHNPARLLTDTPPLAYFTAATARLVDAERMMRDAAEWTFESSREQTDFVNPAALGVAAAQQAAWGNLSPRAAGISLAVGGGLPADAPRSVTPSFPAIEAAGTRAREVALTFARSGNAALFNLCPTGPHNDDTTIQPLDAASYFPSVATFLNVPVAKLADVMLPRLGFTPDDLDWAIGVVSEEVRTLPARAHTTTPADPTTCSPVNLTADPPVGHPLPAWRAWTNRYGSVTKAYPAPFVAAPFDPLNPYVSGTSVLNFPPALTAPTLASWLPITSAHLAAADTASRGVWLTEHLLLQSAARLKVSTLQWKDSTLPVLQKTLASAQGYAGSTWAEVWPGAPSGSGRTFTYAIFSRDPDVTLPDHIVVGYGLRGYNCMTYGSAAGTTPCIAYIATYADTAAQAADNRLDTRSLGVGALYASARTFRISISSTAFERASADDGAPMIHIAPGPLACTAGKCKAAGATFDAFDISSANRITPVSFGDAAVATRVSALHERSDKEVTLPKTSSLGIGLDAVPSLENPFDTNNQPLSSFQTYLDAASGAQGIAKAAWADALVQEQGKLQTGQNSELAKVQQVCGAKACPDIAQLSTNPTIGDVHIFANAAQFPSTGFKSCQGLLLNATAAPATVAATPANFTGFINCVAFAITQAVNSINIGPWPTLVEKDLNALAIHAAVEANVSGSLRDTLNHIEDAAYALEQDGKNLVILTKQAQETVSAVVDLQNAGCVPPDNAGFQWTQFILSWGGAGAEIVAGLAAGSGGSVIGGLKNLGDAFSKASGGGFYVSSMAPACAGLTNQTLIVTAQQWFKFESDFVGVLTGINQHVNELLAAGRDLDSQIATLSESSGAVAASAPSSQLAPGAWKPALNPIVNAGHSSLRRARAASFLGRRAIEARLAVDLPSQSEDFVTVSAPAQWANNMFGGRADLFSSETPETYDPEYLATLNDTLKQYLNSYAVQFPYSSGVDERILSLQQLLPPGGHLAEHLVVECADGTIVGPVAGVCKATSPGSKVVIDWRCKLHKGASSYSTTFSVDALATNAWGTNKDGVALVPWVVASNDEFNFRTLDFGVNIVGTSVGTLDPQTGFGAVPYRLGHDGQTTVADASMIPRSISFPSAVVASAQARVADSSLTTPLVGNELTSMQSYLRTEFQGRPPGGTYALKFYTSSGTDMCAATDVQFYMKLLFWVRNGK
jgi:hypothetical protein